MLWLLSVNTLCFFAIALAHKLTGGCPTYHQQPGLRANFYTYPFVETGSTHEQKDWFLTGIKRSEYLGSRDGITQPNFGTKHVSTPGTIGSIYGFNITVSHFAVELIGYYRAPVTGDYMFNIRKSDNGASFQLGLTNGMSCCREDFDSMVDSDSITLQWKKFPANGTREVYLVQGNYYPIRLTLYNQDMGARLRLLVTKPGETKPSTDFTDCLFGPDGSCVDPPSSSTLYNYSVAPYSTIYAPWTGSVPTTYTSTVPVTRTTGSSVVATTSNVVVVATPTTPYSTITEPWTGSESTTYTSAIDVVKTRGKSVLRTSSNIVVVAIPTTPYSTTTKPWTGSGATTYTSAVLVTQTSGSSALITTSNIVVVATPTTPYSTITEPWTGILPTTYTSAILVTETSGSFVLNTTSNVIVVATPTTPYSTITKPWTGIESTTYTSAIYVAKTRGKSVLYTSSNVVVVAIPTTPYRTTTKPWTGSESTTYISAIAVTTVSDRAVLNHFPLPSYSTMTAIPATQSSGRSVLNTTSDVVVVAAPTSTYSTSTEYWTGSVPTNTSVVMVTKTSGSSAFTTSDSVVVIKIPSTLYYTITESCTRPDGTICTSAAVKSTSGDPVFTTSSKLVVANTLAVLEAPYANATSTVSAPVTFSSAVAVTDTSGGSVFTDSRDGVIIENTELYSTLTVPWSVSMSTTYQSVVSVTKTSKGSLLITTSTTTVIIGTPETSSDVAAKPETDNDSRVFTSSRSGSYRTSPTSFSKGYEPEPSDKNLNKGETDTADRVHETSVALQDSEAESTSYVTSGVHKIGTATQVTTGARSPPIINAAASRSCNGLLASLLGSVYLLLF